MHTEMVTEKLDGQVVCGVVVGTSVQFWSRKGDTVVGQRANGVAQGDSGDYDGLVEAVCRRGCTPVFEMVGKQSRIRADEGNEGRLVLLAVREHSGGQYWDHTEMHRWGQMYQVETSKSLR